MLGDIVTLVVMLVAILFPILIPAAMTALHAVSELRRPRKHAHAVRGRVGYDVGSVPVSA